MIKANIIHVETTTQYFVNGEEITPTAQQKLLIAITGSAEVVVKEYRTIIEVVKCKSKKELNNQLERVANEFKNFINRYDLIVEICK